jgi:hypothetical protein
MLLQLLAKGPEDCQTVPAAAAALQGLDGIATCATALLVLLCQSLPAVSSMSVGAKWWMVIAGQAASVLSSLMPAVHPTPGMVTASRALHGTATAGEIGSYAPYVVRCFLFRCQLACLWPSFSAEKGFAGFMQHTCAAEQLEEHCNT